MAWECRSVKKRSVEREGILDAPRHTLLKTAPRYRKRETRAPEAEPDVRSRMCRNVS